MRNAILAALTLSFVSACGQQAPEPTIDPARYPELSEKLQKLAQWDHVEKRKVIRRQRTVELVTCQFALRSGRPNEWARGEMNETLFDLQKMDLEGAEFQGKTLQVYCKHPNLTCGELRYGRGGALQMKQLVFPTGADKEREMRDVMIELRDLCRHPELLKPEAAAG